MRVLISSGLVKFHVFEGITDLKGKFLFSEPHVFCWHKSREEDVDAFSDSEGHGNDSVCCWFSIKAADKIRKVIEDGEIVLDDDDVVIMCLQVSDHC